MCFNNFETFGEKVKASFFLSSRLFLRGIFQHLHTKTTGKGVFDKLQKVMFKNILEVVVSVIFFHLYNAKGSIKQFLPAETLSLRQLFTSNSMETVGNLQC